MAEFRRYVCWSPVTAGTTISTEAVSPSPSVFFATHAPLRIRRRHPEAKADDRGTAVTEEDVRRDFLGRPTVNGVLLMPVTGESGTGKSHLVRWVQELTPSTDKRLVIHLPKTSTSLRAVVRTLLDQPGIDSPDLVQLRADVDRMSSELDVDTLQRRLILELSEAVAVADPRPGPARVLAGPDRLAALLLDPHVRDHLLQEGKLIPRLAASLLSDRRERDDDRPAVFSPNDLPLDIADVKKASDKAQKLLGLLSRPELKGPAADILTERLPVAVTAAWNMGGGRLQQAMLEIRRQYARQGKEIVLLIEDFVVLQGVQRDLLDALIEAGVRGGKTDLAPIRTLMAVTTGYWQRLEETVLTRAKAATPYLYDLDVTFATDEQGKTDITAFVGRYLNAARLGQEALDAANVVHGADVPNRCVTCDFQETCHSTFGASAEGHGLYPFNWPALRRTIRARPAHNSPDAFNPRAVIGEVIRPVIVDHAQSLADGTFPDERFRQDYPTPADEPFLLGAVQREIEERDSADAGRRKTFLEVWGDAPENLINLDPHLHQAFGINLLTLDAATSNAGRPATDGRGVPPAPGRRAPTRATGGEVPRAIAVMIDHVEEWQGRQTQLPQGTAAYLRGIIRQAVVNRCGWADPVTAEPSAADLDRAWPSNSTVVSIDDAGGQRLPGTADAPIRFKRNPGNATFFRQLLLAGTEVAGNAAAVRRLHDIAERHQKDLQHAVQRHRGFSDDDLILGIRASLLGAALAGHAWPSMTDTELLDAALADGSGWTRLDVAGRTPQWTRLWEAHQQGRGVLVARLRDSVGFTRGVRGGVRIIDGARALPLVRDAAQQWAWTRPGKPLATWIEKAVSGLHQVAAVAETQHGVLSGQLDRIRALLPSGVSASETMTAVDQALRASVNEGLGPPDLAAFQSLLAEVRQHDWRSVDRLERDLARVNAAQDGPAQSRAVLEACAVDRGADITTIERFLTVSDEWLTSRLEQARLRDGGSGESAALRVQELLRQWAEVSQ